LQATTLNDPRGSLFIDFVRIIKEIEPRFFVMENVKGLLSAAIRHRPLNRRGISFPPLDGDEIPGSALKVVLAELKSLGYTVIYQILQAANYGVPQSRERVVFIGFNFEQMINFPAPTHSQKGESLLQWRTLQEALSDLVDSHPEFVSYSKKRLRYLKLLKEGQNWKYLPKELQEEAMGGAYKSGGGKVGFYRRLAWNKPSPTITTSPYQKATDMCHPSELRPLSVRECARIQTFPDDWVFHGSVASKYRQIGNAVPVKLAQVLGKHIYNVLQN
jgi:DNA (cytosine-5)-methyltransferase 1